MPQERERESRLVRFVVTMIACFTRKRKAPHSTSLETLTLADDAMQAAGAPSADVLNSLRTEQLKLAHATQFEEYKSLRAEIMMNLQAQFNITTLTLSAAGIIIASANTIVSNKSGILFGVSAIAFYTLNWTQQRYILSVGHFNRYLRSVTIPKLRSLVDQIYIHGAVPENLLNWEYDSPRVMQSTGLIHLPISVSRTGLPMMCAVGCFLAYLFTRPSHSQLKIVDFIVIGANTVSGLYTVVISVYNMYWLQQEVAQYSPRSLE